MTRRAWRRLIRGRWWTVRLAAAAELQRHAAKGETLLGLTLYQSAEILVLDTLRGAELIEILAHEWEHAEHPEADHRTVHRRSRQLAGVIAAVVDGAHRARPRGR